MSRVAIIIPAYNEASRIGAVISAFHPIEGYDLMLIVVDDGSRDGTSRVATAVDAKIPVTVLRHRTNLGKGGAVKTGCEAALQMGIDCIVMMDADGQHKPEDVVRLLTVLEVHPERLVIGARTFSKEMPFMMRFGNTVLSRMVSILYGITVTDTQSGFRAFHTDLYPKIRWNSTNYTVETEMLLLAAKAGAQFKHVPIDTVYLDNYKGTTPIDGIRVAIYILQKRLLGNGAIRPADDSSLSSSF